MSQLIARTPGSSRPTRRRIRVPLLLLTAALLTRAALCGDWYAAPQGRSVAAGGSGTLEDPWDLPTAFTHGGAIGPGDTVWFREGIYRIDRKENVADVVVTLNGTAAEPIVFRAYPHERARIDARIQLSHAAYGRNLTFRGLEFFTSEWVDWDRNRNGEPAPGPEGGINLLYGENVRIINCFMHSTAGPINAWNPVAGIEIYGNVLFDNGYRTDRYNGPAVYSQNRSDNPVRRICDNIILDDYSHGLQIYGSSRSQVHGFHIEGNFFRGLSESDRKQIILGGGGGADNPATNLHALHNVFYDSGIQLGFGSGHSVDLSAVENSIYHGDIVQSGTLTDVRVAGNFIWNGGTDPEPSEPMVFVRRNRYEPGRLHVAVFRWGDGREVALDLGDYLKPGDAYEVRDPKYFFGDPLLTGEYRDTGISVPVPGEFGVFIIVIVPPAEDAP